MEVVVMRNGTPLPCGQVGEVVITTLSREAMPLLRCRTGDAATMLLGPCACGSPLRRLGRIEGRVVRQGNHVHVQHLPKGGAMREAAEEEEEEEEEERECR